MKTTQLFTAVLMLLALVACAQTSQQENTADITSTETTLPIESSSLPTDATYTLDASRSTLTYFASRIVGNSHTGTVAIKEGNLVREDNSFSSGSYVVDMSTISDSKNSERYLAHVKSEDFFAVETYPESRFVITLVDQLDETTYTVAGDLTIKDQTHSISFPAQLTTKEDGALEVTAAFEIDRTAWGIVYDSGTFISDIGDRAIKDEVQFELTLVFDQG